MNKKDQETNASAWNFKSWLYVIICIIAIYLTVPLARSIQIYVYNTLGKEFFTYIVLIIICSGLVTLLYLFIFKFKIRKTSQYIWLTLCAGSCIYFTIHLRQYPEEAVHLLEYGILSILIFNALSCKIRDRTVYLTAGLLVLLTGTLDEFLQWLIPGRHWGYKDVGINVLAGGFFLLAIARGIRPNIISSAVRKASINFLFRVIAVNVVVFALCLSNTPARVRGYSTAIPFLSWLQSEETMTEYGYKHIDNEIGTFFSRFTTETLKDMDYKRGRTLALALKDDIGTHPPDFEALTKRYNQYSNPFMYEFLLHLWSRNANLKTFNTILDKEEKNKAGYIAYTKNAILEKYFITTLKNSYSPWAEKTKEGMQNIMYPEKEKYISKAGTLITLFSQRTAWLGITIILIAAWILCEHWKKRVSDDS